MREQLRDRLMWLVPWISRLAQLPSEEPTPGPGIDDPRTVPSVIRAMNIALEHADR